MVGFSNKGRNDGGVGSYINVQNSSGESKKCFCTITRMVTGNVMLKPADPTWFKIFLSIIIVKGCEEEKSLDYGTGPADTISTSPTWNNFSSTKVTPCYNQECRCPNSNYGTPGFYAPGACVASMKKLYTSRGGDQSDMPTWAKEMITGAPIQQVAQSIAVVQLDGDPMASGPYDKNGHPKCPVSDECCTEINNSSVIGITTTPLSTTL